MLRVRAASEAIPRPLAATAEPHAVGALGFPASSFTNQSGCCWNTWDVSDAMNGATQMAGSNPFSLICFRTPLERPRRTLFRSRASRP